MGSGIPAICRDTGLRDTKAISRRETKNTAERTVYVPGGKEMNPKARLFREQKRLPESFDSPVIYGVRVETSNPYHLLISNVYILCPSDRIASAFWDDSILSIKPRKVKPKILCFTHFFTLIFVQNLQKSEKRFFLPYEKPFAGHIRKKP